MDLSLMIEKFVEKYPCCELQDIFKLIYLVIVGPDEIPSVEYAEMYLKDECLNIEESYEEEFDYLTDEVVRVNLYPYIKNGGSISDLAEAYYKSQFYFYKDYQLLKETLEINRVFMSTLSFFNEEEYDNLMNALIENDFQSIHHSEEYKEIYHPHYRIICKNMLEIMD